MNEFRIFNWTFCGSNSRIVILNNWLLLPLKVDAEDHVEEVMEDVQSVVNDKYMLVRFFLMVNKWLYPYKIYIILS